MAYDVIFRYEEFVSVFHFASLLAFKIKVFVLLLPAYVNILSVSTSSCMFCTSETTFCKKGMVIQFFLKLEKYSLILNVCYL